MEHKALEDVSLEITRPEAIPPSTRSHRKRQVDSDAAFERLAEAD